MYYYSENILSQLVTINRADLSQVSFKNCYSVTSKEVVRRMANESHHGVLLNSAV